MVIVGTDGARSIHVLAIFDATAGSEEAAMMLVGYTTWKVSSFESKCNSR